MLRKGIGLLGGLPLELRRDISLSWAHFVVKGMQRTLSYETAFVTSSELGCFWERKLRLFLGPGSMSGSEAEGRSDGVDYRRLNLPCWRTPAQNNITFEHSELSLTWS